MGKKDIIEHAYVKRYSKTWYKLRDWYCIPCPTRYPKKGYDTFSLIVESRLAIIRALELQEKRIQRAELKIKLLEGG